jgi:type IV secretory pathway TraG/TraD family ATPase VirD4
MTPLSLHSLTQEQWALAMGTALTLGALSAMKLAPQLKAPSFNRLRSGRRKNALGVEIAGRWITDEARLRHTHIVGATGSGKTVLLEQLIYRDLERGHGALIIDPKGDRAFYERIRTFCRKIGRDGDLRLLSTTYAEESVVWNPCRLGSASELQSKFYQASIYSEPHYAKACELALLKVFNQLDESHDTFSLREVLRSLEELSRGGKDETLAGLFLDLGNLTQGEWGALLGARPNSRPEISLLDLTRKNEILFVDLPTEGQAVQSARLGRLLLQEITLISGLRKLHPHLRSDKPFSVFVDEFDAFASPAFATFLNKGRSSDFMIHLAHQTLSDLNRVSPDFMGQIMGNMNVRFIFRQDSPDDAELWSRFFGTRSVVKQTFRTKDGLNTGESSNRITQEFRVSPDTIKELGTGACVFSIKSQKGEPTTLQIPFRAKNFEPAFIKKRPHLRRELRSEGEGSPGTALSQVKREPGALIARVSEVASLQAQFGIAKKASPEKAARSEKFVSTIPPKEKNKGDEE